MLSARSKERIDEKIRELVPRNFGDSLDACIRRLNEYLRGWIGFFGICTAEEQTFQALDAHIRRRLRALQLQHWKRKRTIVRKLIALGIRRKSAWQTVYEGRKAIWALSHTSVVHRALRNSYFEARKLESITQLWSRILSNTAAPVQLMLPLG